NGETNVRDRSYRPSGTCPDGAVLPGLLLADRVRLRRAGGDGAGHPPHVRTRHPAREGPGPTPGGRLPANPGPVARTPAGHGGGPGPGHPGHHTRRGGECGMTALVITRMAPPLCCGSRMDWDVFRALYVCGTCGATR